MITLTGKFEIYFEDEDGDLLLDNMDLRLTPEPGRRDGIYLGDMAGHVFAQWWDSLSLDKQRDIMCAAERERQRVKDDLACDAADYSYHNDLRERFW